MKQFLTIVFIWTCISAYSQNYFASIDKEVNTWFESVNSVSTKNTKTTQSINFPEYNYSINGILAKGILSDGTVAKFYNTKSVVPELLLEGKVSYQDGRLVIEGIRYMPTSKSTNMIYGTFYVCNMDIIQ